MWGRKEKQQHPTKGTENYNVKTYQEMLAKQVTTAGTKEELYEVKKQ